MFNLNPKKMEAMMKQMGMSQEQIDASRVTIEKSDGSNIRIENPSVMKLKIQGQETFQISGDISEGVGILSSEASSGLSHPSVADTKEDINTIVEKTGASSEKARESLEKTGDLAESIIELSS